MEFVSKETIKRLLRDVKQIMQQPLIDNGIYYCHDDKDMLKGYALIIGPEDTPYFGGNYFFEFKYPADYPHAPPKVTYCTNGDDIRFNPNLYKCGKVCVSILNTWSGDQWTSCQTISTVLLTLCTLLCKNPLLNEPGITEKHLEIEKYNNIIEHANLNVAICNIITRKEGCYRPFFELFYLHVAEIFLKNYDKIVEFSQKKKEEMKEVPLIAMSFYNMAYKMNYDRTLQNLEICRHLLQESKNV